MSKKEDREQADRWRKRQRSDIDIQQQFDQRPRQQNIKDWYNKQLVVAGDDQSPGHNPPTEVDRRSRPTDK